MNYHSSTKMQVKVLPCSPWASDPTYVLQAKHSRASCSKRRDALHVPRAALPPVRKLISGRDPQPVNPCLCRAALARKRIRLQRSRSSSEASGPQQQCFASQRRSSGASQRAIRPNSCSLRGSVGSTGAMATEAIRAPIVPARPGSHREPRATVVSERANGP